MAQTETAPDLLKAQIDGYLDSSARVDFLLLFPRELEARYDRDRRSQFDARPRILAFVTLVIGLFTAGDYALLPSNLERSLFFRVGILLPSSVATLWLLRQPRMRGHRDLLYLVFSLIAAACCVAAFPGYNPVTSLCTQTTFVLLVWTIVSATQLKMPLALVCLGCLLLGDTVFLLRSPWLTGTERLTAFAQFSTAAILSGIARHRSDYIHRVAYLLRLREKLRRAELSGLNAHLARISTHDPLTGLANRRLFDQQLHTIWNRALREDAPVSVAMIDVDHFKNLNDTYGHAAGDVVLVFLADTLRSSIRTGTDIAARFGGEEFVILFPGLTEHETLQAAERLRLNIANATVPISATQPPLRCSVSCGVATMRPVPSVKPSDLIEIADAALYRAKRQGRNRVCV
jgi:diguanylate cyclase (GGDEF)-like protein